MAGTGHPRVALVHDWLTGMRGGEKCLESLCRRWPDAPLYTLLHRRGSVSPIIENRSIHPSFLQRFPEVHRYYRYLLPLMPFAASWRIRDCELLVSMSHAIAKAAIAPRGVPHVCYCFTPMRYAWHMRSAYFGQGRLGRIKGILVDRLLRWIRDWDRATAAHVTHFIAISRTIQQRIADSYQRQSVVIYPPADTDYYTPAAVPREDYYLVVSAFAPYKRIDLAITACARLRKRLVIIGSGQDRARLQSLGGSDIEWLGWQPDEVIRDHYRRCKALLFPGEEDFGIVPVEANACGAPVIAFGRGGATETILPLGEETHPTGVLFADQTLDSLVDAIERFERHVDHFPIAHLRAQAKRFQKSRYEQELFAYLDRIMHPSAMQTPRRAA